MAFSMAFARTYVVHTDIASAGGPRGRSGFPSIDVPVCRRSGSAARRFGGHGNDRMHRLL